MIKKVLYSNDVVAPKEMITVIDNDLYYLLQNIDDANNIDGKRYAHYYEEKTNEYDIVDYHYIKTINA